MLKAEHLDQFADELAGLASVQPVLSALHRFVHPVVNVYAVFRVPIHAGDSYAYFEDKNVFFHSSVKQTFRDAFWPIARKNGISPMALLAFQQRQLLTWTEGRRELDARGTESWLFDLAQQHGMRDGAYCPSGAWMIGYWSPHVLRARYKLTEKTRGCLFMAAGFVAHRLEKIIGREKLNGTTPNLTAPQKAVLRMLAQGFTQDEIARRLKRSKDTVRDHLEAARKKLGARNSHHAAQIARELHLIIVI
jgi:DNA-binding CsgD family transcriptional regulator